MIVDVTMPKTARKFNSAVQYGTQTPSMGTTDLGTAGFPSSVSAGTYLTTQSQYAADYCLPENANTNGLT